MEYSIEELEIINHLSRFSIQELNGLTFIPENIETANNKEDLIYTESVIELQKYFKINNLNINPLGGEPELYRSRKNADIYLPAIFIAYSTLSENPNIVSLVLNIISSFIYDNIKGTIGRKTAKIELYIEKKKGKISKLKYKGDAEGLKNLEEIIKGLK
ncbi:hypothetical protein FLACOL_00169 [Flavobacterium columnare]|uniref:Uncharacterized protein n=2 Tax=Flavobacterium TaxID=237 RepID=A0A2N9P777_9FLAO|nr:hypothetical protein [Flavobacterium columnare]RVU91506.1 hypothetical protein EH230_11665 [Flavobacterium columnare]SPE76191.1 hypothetical protein FLACOL_00169 [Flavobacterium columnare]